MEKLVIKKLSQDDSITKSFVKNVKRATDETRRVLSASRPYDLLVFIGRFQPLHKGHQRVIDYALEQANNVLVIVGSSFKARSVRNPFTFDERVRMINCVYPDVIVEPVRDYTYNDTQWVVEVQKIVKEHALQIANPGCGSFRPNGYGDLKIGLVGCEKDHTSYYLKLFPQWFNEGVKFLNPLNATDIRNDWLGERSFKGPEAWGEILDPRVMDMMAKFDPEIYYRLRQEYAYIQTYKKTWGTGPFLTADALVQVAGNILLVKRGREYGHGLYALPGGFVQENERFLDASIRELKEETRLKVPVPVLKGSIVNRNVFDDPNRSERGRLVTECYHYKLENELSLPEVRGSDDAEWAGFVDIADLKEDQFFEDHYHIIRKMLGV